MMARQFGPIPYVFTEDDLEILRSIVVEHRNRINNPSGRPVDTSVDPLREAPSPATYLAWCYEGIPAAVSYREDTLTGTAGVGTGTGTIVGTGSLEDFLPYMDIIPSPGECDIYQTISGIPTRIGITQTVYNTSINAVPAGSVVVVSRDAFGDWYIVSESQVQATTISFEQAGVLIGDRPALNFTSGATLTDDLTNNRVNVAIAGSGNVTVGTFDSQPPSSDGATAYGDGVIYFQSAGTSNGMVNTGVQTFYGAKTFAEEVITTGLIADSYTGSIFPGASTVDTDNIRIPNGSYGSGYIGLGSAPDVLGTGILGPSSLYIGWAFSTQFSGAIRLGYSSIIFEGRSTLSGFGWNNYVLAVRGSDGTVHLGAWTTVSGMTFAGGLYISGSLSVAASSVSGLATVATTGAYSDLTGLPTLGTASTHATTDFDAAGAAAAVSASLSTIATSGAITDATGTLLVTHGGTGLTALTAHALYAGAGTAAPTALAVGTTNTVLHGNTGADPSWSAVVEADLSFTDVATANASATAHGLLRKLDGNAAHYLDGTGTWSTPPVGGSGTVTSVTAGAGLTGGTITGSGTIALATPVSQANGGTGKDTSTATDGQLLIGKTSDHSLNLVTLTAGSGISITNGAGSITISATGGSGTVTSVGASGPTGIMTWSAAVTGAGTLTATLTTQAANLVLAGPTSGLAAAPTFRALAQADLPALNGLTLTDPVLADVLVGYHTSNVSFEADRLLGLARTAPGGRLTGVSGSPVANGNSLATLYYTPYLHDVLRLWDGTRWVTVQFAETGLSLASLTASKPYDVFGFLSGGVLALEKLVWTSANARATAVTVQDGRYCKSGDKTRFYLGSVWSNASGNVNDNASTRGVWNAYNRVARRLLVVETTSSWTTTGTTWHALNSNTGNRVEVLAGLAGDALYLTVACQVSTADNIYLGVGVDSTSADSSDIRMGASGAGLPNAFAILSKAETDDLSVGYHYFQALEKAQAGSPTSTLYGDAHLVANASVQSGIVGWCMA